jgi:DNA replication protein DnaC
MPGPSDSGACPTCQGTGYLVEQVLGAPARARRCTCQAECPRCHESGFVLVQSGASSVAQPCSCRHLDERIALFNRLGIPAVVAKASFETTGIWSQSHERARAVAQEFAYKFRSDKPTKGFLLYGTPGAGKTHLLVATLRYLALEKGIAGRYVEFMLLLSDIKAGFDSGRSHMEILRPLLAVPVLAIDELGKERGTEWERSMLDELISRRFNSGLATLFATNYFLEERVVPERAGARARTTSAEFQSEAESMTLAKRIGDRIFSRLNEMCTFVKLEPGMDLRKSRPDSGGFYGGR